VNCYVRETGSGWVIQITDATAANEIFWAALAGPETLSAIVRRSRGERWSARRLAATLAAIRFDYGNVLVIVKLDRRVIGRAMDITENHGLRGFDAAHLAAALVVATRRRARGDSPLTFVSADGEQLAAAAAEGLQIEDPNQHA
jgi:uncharacterized protein